MTEDTKRQPEELQNPASDNENDARTEADREARPADPNTAETLEFVGETGQASEETIPDPDENTAEPDDTETTVDSEGETIDTEPTAENSEDDAETSVDADDETIGEDIDGAPDPDADESQASENTEDSESSDASPEEADPLKVRKVVEGLLFVSNRALSVSALNQALPSVDRKLIRGALAELQEQWSDATRGFHLLEVSGGYQFRSDPEIAPHIRDMLRARPMRLSKPALETLAIVAYRQPVTRAEIEDIRGVDAGGVLRMLLEKKMLRILGKREEPGRPLIYGTSREFLEIFHLRSLKDLPTLQEFQELSQEHQIKIDETYGREDAASEENRDPDEDPLFIVSDSPADISRAARELESAADELEEAVALADSTLKEVLERKPEGEDADSENEIPPAPVEIISAPEDVAARDYLPEAPPADSDASSEEAEASDTPPQDDEDDAP